MTNDNQPEDFWAQAKFLYEVMEKEPHNFKAVLGWEQIGFRKALYLVAIYRAFAPLGIPKERLVAIGWTKLSLLAPTVQKLNVEDLLRIAEESTVFELEELLQGRQPKAGTRVVLLRLPPRSYQVFEKAVLMYGAKTSGRGLVDKERALVKALKMSLGE